MTCFLCQAETDKTLRGTASVGPSKGPYRLVLCEACIERILHKAVLRDQQKVFDEIARQVGPNTKIM